MGTKILAITKNPDIFSKIFPSLMKSGYEVLFSSPSSDEMCRKLREKPDIIFVDALSLNLVWLRDVSTFIKNKAYMLPVLLLTSKGKHVPIEADEVIYEPITWRKLFPRLRKLVGTKRFLKSGEVTLDLLQRMLIVGGKEHHLTPKLAQLLEIFMRNRGKILTRPYLIKKVWNTDYVDDTRTLDVHICWLRRLLPENYLKTVKKIGYKFDVPSAED
ncbi:MAG: response regulator transcription factor [Anaerolineae bacterium]|nr:response regulator transcription factor [Anaerolineae bacterium]MDW8102815.1 response regulator transcription factor [Anaerolineae bacterium]